tara:strand:- start:4529 stop:4954 length:426 start_codon:yes stop_codon:yes gene_type:complete
MSTVTRKPYESVKALKNGGASTIESRILKKDLSEEYVSMRDEHIRMKVQIEKSIILQDHFNQLKMDNDTKLKQNTAHQKTIKDLKEQIKYLKEGYGKLNIDDTDSNNKLKEENKKLKEENETFKFKHDKLSKMVTELYDNL